MARRRSKQIQQLRSLISNTRSKPDSLNALLTETNRKLRELKTHGERGTYASKTLLNRARLSDNLYYDKRSNQIRISGAMNSSQRRLAVKNLSSFVKSKTSNYKKLREVRSSTMTKVQSELKSITGKEVSKKDVDKFYSISKFASKNLSDQIDPSELYALCEEAKENNYTESYFVEILGNYVDINDENLRKQAIDLYNKYVRI